MAFVGNPIVPSFGSLCTVDDLLGLLWMFLRIYWANVDGNVQKPTPSCAFMWRCHVARGLEFLKLGSGAEEECGRRGA